MVTSLVPQRILVTGWFSLDSVVATVGDDMAAQTVVDWLREEGNHCDILYAPYLSHGRNWQDIDPARYDTLVFVSGPLIRHDELSAMLSHFRHLRRLAVNVSRVPDGLEEYFDVVIERDSPSVIRSDLAMASPLRTTPVVAVAFAPPQSEYPTGQHVEVRRLIEEWLQQRAFAVVPLTMDMFVDGRHEVRPQQIESLVQRCDVVVSMRLHAMIMAFRNSRPVIAVDAIPGGAKVSRQAAALGWPAAVTADEVSSQRLDALWDFCTSLQVWPALAAVNTTACAGVDRVHALLADGIAHAFRS